MPKRIFNIATLTLLLLALIIGGYFYWLHQKMYPSTDDAYVETHVINIAAQVSGKVNQVLVKNQQAVLTHQLLFTLDPIPFQIADQKAQADLENTKQQVQATEHAVDTARAELAQREAQWINAKKNYVRIVSLVRKGFYSKSGGDDALREVTVAKEAVVAAENQLKEVQSKLGKSGDQNSAIQAAQAMLAQAKLNLQYTKIYSPADGHLAKMNLQPGQTVTAYESLFSLVQDHLWWVMANMKETDLTRVRPGQPAVIHVDMYPSHVFKGIVASISPGSGSSFSLLPAENASGNWVKITQRFPVRIMMAHPDPQFPLRIGASCTVTINTT